MGVVSGLVGLYIGWWGEERGEFVWRERERERDV